MSDTNRRYDIDWLRVIAIGLLIIYHIAIVFQPWGVFIGFIQSNQSLETLWPAMAMLNVWRIPLLFFVSGMGVFFAIRKRNWKGLLMERTKRILVPFLFGMVCIVPLHLLVWQNYYSQDLSYAPQPGHLWFLANIFAYVLVLSPLFFYLKRNENSRMIRWLRKVFRTPLGLLFIIACFVLEVILVKPETFALYALTFHGSLMGLLAFLFGFVCTLLGDVFWQTVLKWRWPLLFIATGLYVIRLVLFDLSAPLYLMAIESNMWIFAVFGFAYSYLNHPGKALAYLSQGAYPIYILHMIFLYLGSAIIIPLKIPALLQFILVLLFTGTGCFVFYELIKGISFLRPFFGLKLYQKNANQGKKG